MPVPGVLALDADNGWMMMEFVEGGTVREKLQKLRERLKGVETDGELRERREREVKGLMERVGEAVGRMHDVGIVHGDLTTSNLMLRSSHEGEEFSTPTNGVGGAGAGDLKEKGGCGSNKIQATESELFDAILDVWKTVEMLQVKGVASKTGVAEFGCEQLKKFLPRTFYRPTVNQINVRDACVVPQPMMELAKQEGIELLTHNDCTNILPQGTLRELLGDGPSGAGILAGPNAKGEGLKGDLSPEWVVKYTAVVRDRGVIEHKGYFASVELSQGSAP